MYFRTTEVKSKIHLLRDRKLLSGRETEGVLSGLPKTVFSGDFYRAKPQGEMGPRWGKMETGKAAA